MHVPINQIVAPGTSTFAINVPDLRFASWILELAEGFHQTVILQISERVLKNEGNRYLKLLISMAESFQVPVATHIDHCKSEDLCKTAIDAGVKGVLFDGGSLSLEENIKTTRRVVDYGASAAVCVEGEVSAIPGEEDGQRGLGSKWVSPEDTRRFVEESGVFSFAPFFGNFHGHYGSEYRGFDTDYLTEISRSIQVPIVIHGGSGIQRDVAQKILAAKPGKINFSTDFKKALLSPVNETDPYLAGRQIQSEVRRTFENLRSIWR